MRDGSPISSDNPPDNNEPDTMTDTKTSSRTDELRAALSQAEADLADARERLGIAVADADDSATSVARTESERLERLVGELRSALPIAECRDREARNAEAQRQQRAREKAQNKARKARIAQARRVDKLMSELGREYDKLLSLETGGTGADTGRVARRTRYSARGALAHFAGSLSRVLEVPVIPKMHRKPLADSESVLIREFDE